VAGGLLYGPLIDRVRARSAGARCARGDAGRLAGGRADPARGRFREGDRIRALYWDRGSVGREGPIVQIGSAVGSSLGQWLNVSEQRLRLFVACGAAGGISATFNAPIAGIMFGVELILRDFEAESFGIVVLSSVAVVGRGARIASVSDGPRL
jgi:CIC family chloride channel protein